MKLYLLYFSFVMCISAASRKIRNIQLPTLNILLETEDGTSSITLRYELIKNAVSAKFVRLLRKILLGSKVEVRYTSWAMYPKGEKYLTTLYSNLVQHITYFNENNGAGLSFQTIVPPKELLTTHQLNLIHSEFETFIVMTQNNVPTGEHNLAKQILRLNVSNEVGQKLEKALNLVNSNVHALEGIIGRGIESYNSYFSAYLYSSPSVPSIPLSPDDVELFQLDSKFGDLLLGYGTTGKSIYDIYKNRDLSLLNAGGRPSPQQFVTSNILACFYNTQTHNEIFTQMISWLKQHKVGETLGLNVSEKIHGHGFIKLGQLILPSEWQNMTENDIIATISPYSKVAAYTLSPMMTMFPRH